MGEQLTLFPQSTPALGPPALSPVSQVVVYSPPPTVSGDVVEAHQLPARQGAQFEGHSKFPAKVLVDEVGKLDKVCCSARRDYSVATVVVKVGDQNHRLMIWVTLRKAKALVHKRLGKQVRVQGTATIDDAESRTHFVDPGKVSPIKPKKKKDR